MGLADPEPRGFGTPEWSFPMMLVPVVFPLNAELLGLLRGTAGPPKPPPKPPPTPKLAPKPPPAIAGAQRTSRNRAAIVRRGITIATLASNGCMTNSAADPVVMLFSYRVADRNGIFSDTRRLLLRHHPKWAAETGVAVAPRSADLAPIYKTDECGLI